MDASHLTPSCLFNSLNSGPTLSYSVCFQSTQTRSQQSHRGHFQSQPDYHPTTKSNSLRCVYKSTHFTPVVGPSIHHPILENFDSALLPAEAGLLQGSGLNAGSTVHAGKGRAPFFVESCGNHPEDTLETEPITVGGFQTSSLNNHIPTSHQHQRGNLFDLFLCLLLAILDPIQRRLLVTEVPEDVCRRKCVLDVQTVVDL